MGKQFGADTTADEVLDGVDLRGRRILVTGVSSGLGVETARSLAAHGASVIGAARDLDRARIATREVIGDFDLVELDLASLASVRACADRLLADGRPLDLIVANAGVMAAPEGRTADGFETQFGTNHLGHFVLVNRLLPLLHAGGRLVSLSSTAHGFADVDLVDPNFENSPYNPWTAYGRSKTAAVLFAVEFDRRHRERGIRAAAVHPGGIQTNLERYLTEEDVAASIALINAAQADGEAPFRFKSVPQGAATSVWAGVVADANEVGGRYCEDCHVAEITNGEGLRTGVRSYALDSEHAKALWSKSEEMVGERF
jgi:NAD(P)-dependent dehydrogenase (short-subunit alcohol dehydrogenase family)